jgi:hypothetical protein
MAQHTSTAIIAHQCSDAHILGHTALGAQVISQQNFNRRKCECSEKEQKFNKLLIHEAEPFLRSYQFCSYSRTSQHFMQPEI